MSFLKHLMPVWNRGTGDRTRANDAILAALDKELTATEQEAIRSKVESSLKTSTGEWLDMYGKWFGVLRRDAEEDDEYRARIIRYVLLKRGTIPAIIGAIREFLQDYESYIDIYEPFNNIFTLNQSKLNGEDYLIGQYYAFAVIDIRFTAPFPMSIIDIINDFKPAGVRFVLTYRPSTHNPNAVETELPLTTSDFGRSTTNLRIMNGMDRHIRGHIKFTNRQGDRPKGSEVFRTNYSHLNSSDRLAGAFSVTNLSYHLVSYTEEDVLFTDKTRIEDVLNVSSPVSPDFYTKTDRPDDQYASHPIQERLDETKNIHFTMDIGTYLETEYRAQMRENNPSGIYDRNSYLGLIGRPTISYSMKATISSTNTIDYTTQILNLRTGLWYTIDTGKITRRQNRAMIRLDSLDDYLSDQGLVFTRMRLLGESNNSTSYDLHLHYFEIGTYKNHRTEPMIDIFPLRDVSGARTAQKLVHTRVLIDPNRLIDPNASIGSLFEVLLGADDNAELTKMDIDTDRAVGMGTLIDPDVDISRVFEVLLSKEK